MPDTIPGHPHTTTGHTAPASRPAPGAALLARVTETSRDLARLTARPDCAPATIAPRQRGAPTADDQDRDITVQAQCQRLQALEDAIAYRRARVSAPCPDCTASGHTCDDHACDLNLIAAYQQTAIAAIQDVSARVHATPADHDH